MGCRQFVGGAGAARGLPRPGLRKARLQPSLEEPTLRNVSIVIPALNESKTIVNVIESLGASPLVLEVLVVDDHSGDETLDFAAAAGARVFLSPRRGKGSSMREGLLAAKGEIILYADADIPEYAPDLVERLCLPIQEGRADFVKGTFERQAGRVTELVAKPLLAILFPEALRFSQPLSGMIAARKELLLKADFDNDYGVDIGILLDCLTSGGRVEEANIGRIENRMRPWQELAPMAQQVSRAILKRAKLAPEYTLDTLGAATVILDQMDLAVRESLRGLSKLVVLGLDGTLLRGDFMQTAAAALGFEKELFTILSENSDPVLTGKLVGKLFKGVDYARLLAIVDSIPLAEDAAATIAELKRRGYIVGIVSEGFLFVAEHLMHRVGANFAMGHELEFSKGLATGEVKRVSHFARRPDSACGHVFCSSNALRGLAEQYAIPLANVAALGSTSADACAIRAAGIGIAFNPADPGLRVLADRSIDGPSLAPLLEILD